MQRKDTTRPIHYLRHETLCNENDVRVPLSQARALNVRVFGIHHAAVGKEWDSQGRVESDCLHHINLVCSGSAAVMHGRKLQQLVPGRAYLFPGNTPLQRRCRGHYEAIYIVLRLEWFPGIDVLLDWPGRRPIELGAWDRLEWERDWKRGHRPSLTSCLKLQSQLLSWFAHAVPDLDKIITRHLRIHTRFEAVLSHIENHLSAQMRVAELAKISRCSKAAFSLKFSRSTGISPKAYINRRLNEEIIHRLVNTSSPLKHIASELGFADEYHFNRFFSKANGLPPARYRKRFHGNTR